MITLTLQENEASAVKKALDTILKHEETARMIFPSGEERRAAKRSSKKLAWAGQSEKETT